MSASFGVLGRALLLGKSTNVFVLTLVMVPRFIVGALSLNL